MSNDSCSYDVAQTMNDQNLYEKAFQQNPDLAKSALDPGSCKKYNKTTSSSASAAITVVTFDGGGRGTAKKKTNSNVTASSGCSAIAAQYALNASVTNALNCSVSDTNIKTLSKTSQIESLKLVLEDFTATEGVTINVNQNISNKGKVVDFTSSALQTNMASQVTQAVKGVQKAAQSTKDKNVNFSTPAAQKSLQDQVNAAVSSQSQTQTQNIIKSTISSIAQTTTTSITLKGFKTTSVNVSDIQNEANAFVVEAITKNIMGSMMTVTAKSDESSSQSDSQKTSVTGKSSKDGSSDGGSIFLFCALLLGLAGFSIIKVPKKIRATCFYISLLSFFLILLIDHKDNKVLLWISVFLFAIGLIVNVKRWDIGNNMVIGGGISSQILPFPKPITEQQQQQQQPQVQQTGIYKPSTVSDDVNNPLRRRQNAKVHLAKKSPLKTNPYRARTTVTPHFTPSIRKQQRPQPQVQQTGIYKPSTVSDDVNNPLRRRQNAKVHLAKKSPLKTNPYRARTTVTPHFTPSIRKQQRPQPQPQPQQPQPRPQHNNDKQLLFRKSNEFC
jgi:hypothetical protein